MLLWHHLVGFPFRTEELLGGWALSICEHHCFKSNFKFLKDNRCTARCASSYAEPELYTASFKLVLKSRHSEPVPPHLRGLWCVRHGTGSEGFRGSMPLTPDKRCLYVDSRMLGAEQLGIFSAQPTPQARLDWVPMLSLHVQRNCVFEIRQFGI